MEHKKPARLRAIFRLERWFPGLGWRPLCFTVVSTWALVLYYHHGKPKHAPQWFLESAKSITTIEVTAFHRFGWAHLTSALFLLVVPLIAVRLAGPWRLTELGWGFRKAKSELFLVIGLWLAFVPVIWIFSDTAAFARTYPRLKAATNDAYLFWLYETFYLVKWIAWEFFFRGFMLFGFAKDLGIRAVLISTVPFTLMHVGKPEMEMIAALPAGFILCWIAWRSRSFWPGVVLHWLVATTMDFFSSTWWR